MIDWLPLEGVSTVTEVPLTAVTSPPTMLTPACPLGVGRGLAPGGGLPPGPPVAQPLAPFGASRTDVAVRSPAESFVPEATMHSPCAMSASEAVEVLVIVVLLVRVTVMSPLAPVRISVSPLI
ncbi:MAG: hypothetical protein E6J28_13470 [Chloroflexi bacterium]|nr:MAG: hypothetical protein E6J28_13470 [Chloroflexota bacterium]